jgi:Aldehyde oxidase and xanthine dehydrogenase, a/b hammerhead domain
VTRARSLLRVEDARLLVGDGRFVDDVDLPGQLWLRVVRSQVAHANLREVDTSVARATEGVHAVLTAADLPEIDRIPVRVEVANQPLDAYRQPIAPVGSGYFNPNARSALGWCQLLLPRINNLESKAPQNAVRSTLSATDLAVLKRPFLRELISVGRRYKRLSRIALPVDQSHVARTTEGVLLKEGFRAHLVALTSCLSNCLGIRHVIERH